jgi:circadian clock protein KaiC
LTPSSIADRPPSKSTTGIPGFDDLTRGGLPRARTTLIEGASGAGKTVFALQTLVNGARFHREPGIFVAFEETAQRIVANAATFGWDLEALQRQNLFFLDAQPRPDHVCNGELDLGGMLAALDAKVAEMGATRIVFDAVDMVLALMSGPAAVRRETYRLHHWLVEREITGIITAKRADAAHEVAPGGLGFMQFMADCGVVLRHELRQGISQRSVQVLKYRGSGFEENQMPLIIGERGMEVAYSRPRSNGHAPVSSERLSSGVPRLDFMLQGGYFRGSSVLITGAPGTAKTTLCGAFAAAASSRGERTVYVSVDSRPAELVRNLASVGIDLQAAVNSGTLELVPAQAVSGSAELHFIAIRNLARAHDATCVIVDPLSALATSGNADLAHDMVERLVDWAKDNGITLVTTSLLDHAIPTAEATPLQISAIADTWIHLSYSIQNGERNRGLSIVKSRGTAHSSQVRELILSEQGVTLADVYTAGGDVLMGALRREREHAQAQEQARLAVERRQQRIRLDAETAALEARLNMLQARLELKRSEAESLLERAELQAHDRQHEHDQRYRWRGGDPETKAVPDE